jgi:AraC-like DNA-binding protein
MPDKQVLRMDPSRPVRAFNGGLFISRGKGIHPDRVIDSHELIFVGKGRLGMQEGDRPFDVLPGQTLLLWPGRRHQGIVPYPEDLSFHWIHFAMRDAGDGGRGSALALPQHTTLSRPQRLADLFSRFLDDQETGQLMEVQADLLVTLMLCELVRSPEADATEHPSAALAGHAKRHVATHFHEPIGTAQIAEALGCHPDYLGRVYRRVYGHTLTEALHRRRVSEARALLREEGRAIDEVAGECGFDDPGYFRRVFKRYAGMTPRDFRRLYARAHVNAR